MVMPSADEFASLTVFTVPDVAAGRIKPLVVLRQADTGLWYVLPTSLTPPRDAEIMVTMGQLMAFDPSLAALVQMKPGLGARRPKPKARWQAFSLAKPERKARKGSSAVLVGEGHAAPLAGRARVRAFAVNQASLWLILLGTVLALVAVIAVINPPGEAIAGMSATSVIGGGLGAIGLWSLVCGFALGAGSRVRWACLGAALPTVIGALLACWGQGWIGTLPAQSPTWFGVALFWAATRPLGLALCAVALWTWCCALAMWLLGRERRDEVEAKAA